jgi:hypothetical protein
VVLIKKIVKGFFFFIFKVEKLLCVCVC